MLIDDRRGPVREWFEAELPNLKPMQSDWKAAGVPVVLPDGVSVGLLGVIGTAFDYRLRYFYVNTPAEQLIAAAGAATYHGVRVGSRHRTMPPPPDPFEAFSKALDGFLNQHDPRQRLLDVEHERTLARFCSVLALYEAQFRAGRILSPLDDLPESPTLDDYFALIDDPAITDICALTAAFSAQHSCLPGSPCVANPTFALSGRLGGADADLILDGCLIDIKTTKRPTMRREWAYQLLGYLLADTDNAHQVTQIGFYVSRVPALVRWPVVDIVAEVTEGKHTLAELRQQFAAVIPRRPNRIA